MRVRTYSRGTFCSKLNVTQMFNLICNFLPAVPSFGSFKPMKVYLGRRFTNPDILNLSQAVHELFNPSRQSVSYVRNGSFHSSVENVRGGSR